MSTLSVSRVATALIGAAMLVACASNPQKSSAPALPIPKNFEQSEYRSAPIQPSAKDWGPWWHAYGSAELNELVDRALVFNQDLRIANLQVVQASIRNDQAKAGKLPVITAPLRTATQGSGGAIVTQQTSQVGVQGVYRLDIWGEQKNLVESAELQVLRAIFERDNVERNTVAALVSAYVGYLSLGDSLALARENEATAKEILQTVERRFALNDATRDEVEQQKSALYMQQALIPVLVNQREDQRQTIARLVGALPTGLKLTDQGLDALQQPDHNVPLPSSLLLRRPDIKAIEARMRSANANIEVARARLLPPIDLSASAGYSSLAVAQLFDPQSAFWSALASMAVTIFDGSRRENEKRLTEAIYEEMVQTYARTVYQAIRDVESALVGLRATQQRLEAQKMLSRSALNSFRTANEAYAAGALDISGLLEARKNYQRNADELQHVKADLLKAHATLNQALGQDEPVTDAILKAKVGKEGDILLGSGSMDKPIGSGWTVDLNGQFQYKSLPALWRGINSQLGDKLADTQLRAKMLGQFKSESEREQWYAVSVSGFPASDMARTFCERLQQLQQGCKVNQAR